MTDSKELGFVWAVTDQVAMARQNGPSPSALRCRRQHLLLLVVRSFPLGRLVLHPVLIGEGEGRGVDQIRFVPWSIDGLGHGNNTKVKRQSRFAIYRDSLLCTALGEEDSCLGDVSIYNITAIIYIQIVIALVVYHSCYLVVL